MNSATVSAQHQMTVLIAAVGASAHLSGVSRHAINLALCLLSRDEVTTVIVVIGSHQLESFRVMLPEGDPRLQIICEEGCEGAFARNCFYYRRLPLLAERMRADIVHLSFPVPIRRSAFSCPCVVTLHDLYPYDIPSNFGFPKVFFNRVILQQCLRAADAIAAVSESTLHRLSIHAPARRLEKAVTIYNCVQRAACQSQPAADLFGMHARTRVRFLLCVAQHRHNKNVVLALQIFHALLLAKDIPPETRFVVVGIDGPETPRIQACIAKAGMGANVILLQGVPDAELAWYYTHCDLLLAPSSVEGFGLPIVEAMLAHCRVVCSNIPAFREVGGSYCHYADLSPDPLQAFVDACRRALSSCMLPTARTDCFSMAVVARRYVDLYSRLRAASTLHHGRAPQHSMKLIESRES